MQIIVLGINGFPNAFSAKVNRYRSITKMLASSGHNITVLNRNIGKTDVSTIEYDGYKVNVENSLSINIPFYTVYKYFKKITLLFEFVKVFKLCVGNGKRQEERVFMVYTPSLFLFLNYILWAKLFNAKVIYDYVEKRSDFEEGKKNKINRKGDIILENKALKYADGIIVISEYLKNEIKNNFSGVPYLKLPAVCDFKRIRKIEKRETNKQYLLYCGSSAYMDVVYFIINAYKKANISSMLGLMLIVDIPQQEERLINKLLNENINILSGLSYEELISYYKGAAALLIPMRDTIRDIARFPHKISEYVASESLIISTNYGEVKYYFKNKESALIAETYDENKYAEILRQMSEGAYDADGIIKSAYLTGINSFSECANKERLSEFIHKIVNG